MSNININQYPIVAVQSKTGLTMRHPLGQTVGSFGKDYLLGNNAPINNGRGVEDTNAPTGI